MLSMQLYFAYNIVHPYGKGILMLLFTKCRQKSVYVLLDFLKVVYKVKNNINRLVKIVQVTSEQIQNGC